MFPASRGRSGSRIAGRDPQGLDMIELEVSSGVARGKILKTNKPTVSIGRSPEQTLVVQDRSVSRHHGEIVLLKNQYQYRDLNSTHGTLLRRGSDENFIKQVALHEGDELVLGPTDNVIRILRLRVDPVDEGVASLTMMHESADAFGPPEKVFENDSKALRTIVRFDSHLMESNITTERQVYEELLAHIPELFEQLNYVAIIEVTEDGVKPYDFKLIADGAKVRVSTHLAERAADAAGAFVFRVRKEGVLETGKTEEELGESSMLMHMGKSGLDDTSGICAPISTASGVQRFLAFERQAELGHFLAENVTLLNSIVMRARDRIHNLELVRQNQMLNLNATLGVFAGMIGHDIKNYLFFGKKLSDIRDDPLSKHPGILKGIERSRKLAQSMKDLAAPGNVQMKTFSVRKLAESVSEEFASLFAGTCTFSMKVHQDPGEITTSEDLVYRVVWNLVMNAYHTAENRRSIIKGESWVRVALDVDGADRIVIEIQDNAGGIGPRTLAYIQQSFALIQRVHRQEENLIEVVNTINRMEGFTNSVGLFFTGVAVSDMDGEITVSTERGIGSTFRIVLPREIQGLKRLLRF